jgi:hippurate hydrolase
MIDWTHPAKAALPGMTALRRAIHAEPELGLHNPRTVEKIMAALAGLPVLDGDGMGRAFP